MEAIKIKKVSAIKARQQLGQLLEEVYYRGNHYIIERSGKLMAAIEPVWEVSERQKRVERMWATIEAIWERNKEVSPELIEGEIAEAIHAVRQKVTTQAA